MKRLILILTLIFTSYTLAQIINVPADQPTIQAGIDAANNGDTVLVAEGTYFENVLINNKAVTLASHFLIDNDTSHISKTIINGSQPINTDEATTVTVLMSADTSVVCGFTITGGYGHKAPEPDPDGYSRYGGGVSILGSNALICNNKVMNNFITESIVPENISFASGGGIYIAPFFLENLKVIVKDNYISGNIITSNKSAGAGIAIQQWDVKNFSFFIDSNIIIKNSTINNDEWKAMGGGMYLDFAIPSTGERIIRNNIISNNQAICDNNKPINYSFGGGMYIVMIETKSDGSRDNDYGPFIYNNIISENYSDYYGGGISIWRGYFPNFSPYASPLTSAGHYSPKPSIINNTIVNNTALDGAGLFIMNHKPFLMNNIIWNDYPESAEWGEICLGDVPLFSQVEGNKYGGAEMFYNNIQSGWFPDSGEGNINYDPMFEDTLFNLAENSYCVGNGINAWGCPNKDFFGNKRPNSVDEFVDIGAIESNYKHNPLPDTSTGVKTFNSEIPADFYLSQNYPNPFNPSTKIKYSIPFSVISNEQSDVRNLNSSKISSSGRNDNMNVSLKVYDILGREVATLVNQKQKPGNYEVTWEANDFPSGVYFYQLQGGEFTQVYKMLLIK